MNNHKKNNTPGKRGVDFSILISYALCLLLCVSARIAHASDEIDGNISLPQINEQSLKMTGDSEVGYTKELIVLVHGFFRTPGDMVFLDVFFRSRGFEVFAPALPTTFGSLEECTVKLEQKFSGIREHYDRIHFVGHSMGGLIIRLFLSRNRVENIGRCVLIAAPNRGSEFVDAVAWFRPLMFLMPPLREFRPDGVSIPPPLNNPPPEMGAIAGNGGGLFLGRFMKKENDGRVTVDSVSFQGMKDFLVLPYNHDEIHHRRETAGYILRFLKEGTFGSTTGSRYNTIQCLNTLK